MFNPYSPWLYLRDRWILAPAVASAVAQVFLWWYILAKVPYTSDQIFLHYTVIFGVDLIGPWWRILTPAIAGLAIAAVNFFLGWLVYRDSKFLARLVAAVTVVSQVFLVVAAFLLVGLNV